MTRIELHPIFEQYAVYNDHYDGELEYIGDALGRDCMIAAFTIERVDWARLYRNDGTKNEDWFSWNEPVLAPINGNVVKININPIANTPGTMNPSPASLILIKSEDGTYVELAHIQNPTVKVGDTVREGQVVAYVGNNGYARNPHIHIGAFRGDMPLAIGFDAKKVAAVRERVGEMRWIFGIDEE